MLSNYNKPKPVANTNNNQQIDNEESQSVITDQNEYINYKYNFGLSFPDYWKGFNFEENDNGISFSLKNKKGKYISIFNIKVYTSAELGGQAENNMLIYITNNKNNLYFAYLMERNDQDLSGFGDVFASNSYSGLLFDIQNNIIPTFKFIKKGEVFDDKNKFRKDNEFKLIEIKVGDIIAGMTTKFIRTFDGYDMQPSIENQASIDNLSIGFSGEAIITGTYHNDKVDPQTGFGGTVCFDSLDEQSKDKIPSIMWYYDERYISFCFSNQELAREIFKPEGSEGVATIVIDDYVINKMPAEVTDMAKLVKVVSKD